MTAKIYCPYCSFKDYPNRVDLHIEREHTVAVEFHALRSEEDPNIINLQIEADWFGQSIRAVWIGPTIVKVKTDKLAKVVTINVQSHAKVQERRP